MLWLFTFFITIFLGLQANGGPLRGSISGSRFLSRVCHRQEEAISVTPLRPQPGNSRCEAAICLGPLNSCSWSSRHMQSVLSYIPRDDTDYECGD